MFLGRRTARCVVEGSLEDLISLWHGDDDSMGYAHELLAFGVCLRMNPAPKGAMSVLQAIYGTSVAQDLADIDRELLRMVERGFDRFKKFRTDQRKR